MKIHIEQIDLDYTTNGRDLVLKVQYMHNDTWYHEGILYDDFEFWYIDNEHHKMSMSYNDPRDAGGYGEYQWKYDFADMVASSDVDTFMKMYLEEKHAS